MYVKLYKHRDQFVVIDDFDALYADRSGVRLLKCLCQKRSRHGSQLPEPGATSSKAISLRRQSRGAVAGGGRTLTGTMSTPMA
jgi:hypothetical protein